MSDICSPAPTQDLIKFAFQHLQRPAFERFYYLLRAVSDQHDEQLITLAVTNRLVSDVLHRLTLQRNTYRDLLISIVNDVSGAVRAGRPLYPDIRPHLFTFARFGREQEAPGRTEEEIRGELERRFTEAKGRPV